MAVIADEIASRHGKDRSVALQPLVSIVTPTKNSERYIGEVLECVASQTYGNIEHIVVDGGSTDRTIEIVGNSKARLITGHDNGMYEAVNVGLRAAQGSIVAYLNSDDLYMPWTIASVVDYFATSPDAQIMLGAMLRIDADGKTICRVRYPSVRWPLLAACSYSTIGQPSVFWRSTLHDSYGFFDESVKMAADFEFFIRVAKHERFGRMPAVLAKFREHARSMSVHSEDLSEGEVRAIHQKYWNWSPRRRAIRPLLGLIGSLRFKLYNADQLIVRKIRTRRAAVNE